MKNIKRVSLLFRILFQVLFVIFPITFIIFWMQAPKPLEFFHGATSFNFIPKGIAILAPLSASTKIYGFIISLIPIAIAEIILYFLIKLFKLYEQGEIFSLQNVNYIRNIGYTLLIGQILDPIYQALLSGVLTWHNGSGQRFVTITLDGTDAGIVLVVLLTILISWIMAEGCKLREEQKYTV